VNALRRNPARTAQRTERVKLPLGILRLDLDAVDEVYRTMKGRGGSVKIHAGEGVAPRGVSDLDDASGAELQSIRLVSKNPQLVVYLGAKGAYCSHNGSPAADRISRQVFSLLQRHRTWLPPLRLTRLYLFLCMTLALSNISVKYLGHYFAGQPNQTLGSAAAAGVVTAVVSGSVVFLMFEVWKLMRSMNKLGSAAITRRPHPQWLLIPRAKYPWATFFLAGPTLVVDVVCVVLWGWF
jgi:hypothetical protein